MNGRSIQIRTGARLHFGLILGTETTGWVFGGVGLMLQQPGWQLSLQPAEHSGAAQTAQDRVLGSPEAVTRVTTLLQRLRAALPELPPLHVRVDSEVPFHTGLGAGTQLALGVAAACRWLCRQQPHQTPLQLAVAAGRAERSAIGTWGFDHGGFLVDRGATAEPQTDRVRSLALPEDWRIVLVRPRESQGLSGAAESAWFGTRPQMSPALVGTMAGIITERLVPAILDSRFADFAWALQDYGDAAGNFYAGQQGHIFADPQIRRLVDQLRRAGIYGAAQSSWGPGIGIPAASPDQAQALVQFIRNCDPDKGLLVSITAPCNAGASISRLAPESRSDSRLV